MAVSPILTVFQSCVPQKGEKLENNKHFLQKWLRCRDDMKIAGRHENPHAERFILRCNFYKRIQRGTFVAISLENQYLVILLQWAKNMKKKKKNIYEENEDGWFRSSFICSQNVFACLQDQFKHGCSIFNPTYPCFVDFPRISWYISYTNVRIGTTKQHVPSLHRECYRTLW